HIEHHVLVCSSARLVVGWLVAECDSRRAGPIESRLLERRNDGCLLAAEGGSNTVGQRWVWIPNVLAAVADVDGQLRRRVVPLALQRAGAELVAVLFLAPHRNIVVRNNSSVW